MVAVSCGRGSSSWEALQCSLPCGSFSLKEQKSRNLKEEGVTGSFQVAKHIPRNKTRSPLARREEKEESLWAPSQWWEVSALRWVLSFARYPAAREGPCNVPRCVSLAGVCASWSH